MTETGYLKKRLHGNVFVIFVGSSSTRLSSTPVFDHLVKGMERQLSVSQLASQVFKKEVFGSHFMRVHPYMAIDRES
jgi:hypothetical protein